jgi:hypothetical protein
MVVVQTYCFRAYYRNDYARVSDMSPTGVKDNPAPVPTSPGLTVAAVTKDSPESPAFVITTSGARSTALAGLIPVGKQCTGPLAFTYRGRNFHRVNSADVKWWNTTRTTEVAAACI